MKALLSSFLYMLRSCFQTRASMQIEILALRHQLGVLQRRTTKRASLRTADRLLWVMLSRLWGQWRTRACHRQARNSNCVAPKRVSMVLELEEQSREVGSILREPGNTRASLADEHRESALGCAKDSWRIAETRN